MNTTITTDTRTCTCCHRSMPYEPILTDTGTDLHALIPFVCHECTDDVEAQAVREAEARANTRRREKWESIVPLKYRETDTQHPDFPRPLWQHLRSRSPKQSLALIGPAARCKTRILALIAKRAIATDITVGWCPANNFQWAATREFDKRDGTEARQWLKRWHTADVLILDDLGKHRWTDAVESAFFGLLEARASRMLPTHWSMNPDPADVADLPTRLRQEPADLLTRALDPTGDASARPRFAPIISRLLDETTLIPVT
jgi:DNA replication protein DnaC